MDASGEAGKGLSWSSGGSTVRFMVEEWGVEERSVVTMAGMSGFVSGLDMV